MLGSRNADCRRLYDRMASYAISAVRYEEGRPQVQRVVLHEIDRGVLGPPLEIGRDQLVGALESGRTVVTISKGLGRQYETRGRVRLIGSGGRGYVRCDDSPLPCDDLGDLPPVEPRSASRPSAGEDAARATQIDEDAEEIIDEDLLADAVAGR